METYQIFIHSIAGAIPLIPEQNSPSELDSEDKSYLRELAKRMLEAIHKRNNDLLKKEWTRHIMLQRGRPMLVVYPENSWYEMLPPKTMRLQDPFWKAIEWYLYHQIYRAEHLKDDYVLQAELIVQPVVSSSGWGVDVNYKKNNVTGMFVADPPLKNLEDIQQLHIPELTCQKDETQRRLEMVKDVFKDCIPVVLGGLDRLDIQPTAYASDFRGLEQIYIDLYEEPEWLHELMDIITTGIIKNYNDLKEFGLLRKNSDNHYVGSGGPGFTNELPKEKEELNFQDLWGFASAQEFSVVSPEMHDEFALTYQRRLLDQCGLVHYGCCEPMDDKFDLVKKMKNLRRVSISPWCNVDKAVEALQDKYVFSWKPNPTYVCNNMDDDFIRTYLHENLVKARECQVEILLKDAITVQNEPERLERFIAIARDEMQKIF